MTRQKTIGIILLLIATACENKLDWIKIPDTVVPVVFNISPTSGPPGTTVAITGTNFSTGLSGNSVTINGTAAEVIEASSTKIVVITPATTTGPVVVTVNNKQAANKPVFTYQ